MDEKQQNTVSDPQRNDEHGKVCSTEEEEDGTAVRKRKKEKNNKQLKPTRTNSKTDAGYFS